ncbi:MAG: Wzz/FepE/Etk N-terminal domain-containing protein [Bryobacteraceae bacterium]|jgi:polysaccharide chain length determinant protein (PEP-CTERM system associated)
MQPVDSVTITRRAMDVEDYIDVMRRHRSWIFGPAFAFLVGGVVAAFLWPDTYVSSAVIKVVPPQVPEAYVQSNLNQDMNNHIMSMAQSILSRSNLTSLIMTQNLYAKERARQPLEDIIERMQAKDVKIGAVENQQVAGRGAVTAFQISFRYSNRLTAQKVTEDIVSRFISQNIQERSQASRSTTEFLTGEFEDAKTKLEAAEQRLSEFRVRNIGRLPDQMNSNQAQLSSMQMQMTTLDAAISRINQDKLLAENQLRILKDRYNSIRQSGGGEQTVATVQRNDQLAEKERQIVSLENTLAILRERYKDTYPDVQRALSLLAQARKDRDTLLKEDAEKKPDPAAAPVRRPVANRELLDLEANIRRIEGEIAARNLEMKDRQNEMARLTAAMKTLEARIEGVPVGEKEYTDLLRDRDLARGQYDELNGKKNKSEIATKLENTKQGETLDLLDPASLPQTPTEPKRPVIIAVAAAIGFAVGLLFAGAREMKDTSLKNLKDVRAYTRLPILGSIPLLENDLVVRRRRRLAWLAWSTACLLGAVIMSGSVVYYYATRV